MVDTAVAKALDELRALAGDSMTPYSVLVAKAHALLTLAPVSVGTVCPIGQELYRGTSYHTSVPLLQSDISYPPADLVRDYRRANCPGRTVFYCSPDPSGVFKELRSSVGQYAVLAKWVTTRQGVLHGLGYSSSVFQRANAQRPLPEPYREFDASIDANTLAVREFIALEFTALNPSHYRLTAALAEVFLAGDDFAGLVYPTIAKDCEADNLALLPAFVDDSMRLVEAELILVEGIQEDGAVDGQVIARLESVNGGTLKWAFTGSASTIASGKSPVLFRIERGQRFRFQDARTVTISGRVYDVLPGYSVEVVEDCVCVLNLQRVRVEPTDATTLVAPFWPKAYGNDINSYVAVFKSLFAIATDVFEARGERIVLGVCFRTEFKMCEPRWNLRGAGGFGVELHDPTVDPVRLAWAQLLLEVSQRHASSSPIGVIVEAMPGELDRLNSREDPIVGNFYLPTGIELVYGCRGSETLVAPNAALEQCRKETAALADRIKRGELPDITDRVTSKPFSRCRQFDFAMPTTQHTA